ncbi:MAG TPA: hypothetical protein VL154_06785, partial [Acetobacteraceae bacterium]|nr:hypothetical protein [Acetobacteraceae bacterium]
MKFFARFFSKKRRLPADIITLMTVRTRRHPQCRRHAKSLPGFACSEGGTSVKLTSMHPATPATALGQRYLPHIADLCAGVAAVAARHRALAPLLVLVWIRLRRTLARLDRLA